MLLLRAIVSACGLPPNPVCPKDKISLRESKKNQVRVKLALNLAETKSVSDWIEVDSKNMAGTYIRDPERKELPAEINESLIVELYSK